jgi:5-methylcytosine-specific restriction endonuclease McrA
MKICWDNLERLRYNKKTGKWYKGKTPYIYVDFCKRCGDPFLSHRGKEIYCSKICVTTGRKLSSSIKKKISESHKGLKLTKETKKKISESHKGKHLTEGHKKKISIGNKGKIVSDETKRKMSISQKGKNNHFWRGGYKTMGIPYYDTYASKLEWCEEVRRSPKDENILEVKCTYCGRWYVPEIWSVNNRVMVLNGTKGIGYQRFYCSYGCKHACPLYNKSPQTLMKEDAVRAGRLKWLELGREVQSELRQMVLERDNHKCTKCGSEGPLHCHHILPVTEEPLLSADIDNCITLCEECHKEAHKQDGCRYGQLRIEVC